ncbi:hypothetical protein [Bifidobacterium saguini]|uniref:hypothetical protein n=1 Tax=Bifidobacterium saguini TaxID=762210 RepID=UPI00069135FE|nr:hypothetical protein [Bifidobacterium saguini]
MKTTTIPIWNNDTATLDAIMDDARAEAMTLAEETINRHGTDPEHDWLVNAILETGLHSAAAATPWQPLQAEDLRNALAGIDPWADPRLGRAVAEYNNEYRHDEITNLDAIRLERPIAITGKAGVWQGTRTMCSILRFDTLGDILRQAPWNDMDIDDWSIDENDDLRYTGIHHDGTNTCTYRQLKPGARINQHTGYNAIQRMSEPLGPLIRHLYGIQ